MLDETGRDPHAALRRRAASRSDSPPRASCSTRRSPALVDELRGARCPPGSIATRCWRSSASCYRPGATLADAFARLLSALLPELVVLDPSDPALKAAVVPVLARELAESSPTSRLAARGGRSALLAAGYHQQVPVRPGFLNLFVDHGRRAPRAGLRRTASSRCGASARAMPRGGGRSACSRAIRARGARACSCARWPRTISCPPPRTSAARRRSRTTRRSGRPTRTSASRGPVLLPRPSVTLVEPAQARALEAEGLSLPDLQADPEAAARALGARGLPARWRRPSPRARGDRARDGGRSRRRWAPSTPRCARPPTARAAARCTRSRPCTRRRCARSRSATRRARTGCAARATRCCPGGSFQERGLGLVEPRRPPRPRPSVAERRPSACDPFARGPPGDLAVKHRDHVLSDGGRLGRGGGRAGQAARAPRPRRCTSSRTGCPFRLGRASRRTSASTRSTSPPTASSSTRRTTWRWPRRWRRSAREHELDLFHVHYAIPHAITGFLAQQMLGRDAAEADHDAARHRHHARGPGPLVLRDHALRDRALGRRDRGVGVPAADDGGRVPDHEAASR